LKENWERTENVLDEDHMELRRGEGSRDATGMLRIISEPTLNTDEKFCACFIYLQK